MTSGIELDYECEVVNVGDLRLEDCRKVLAALMADMGLVVAEQKHYDGGEPSFSVMREETAEARAARYKKDRGW
jgi:hypothetical protein